ncbi:MAG: MATE family efflux transporter [Bacteroidales bacterium]|nr:MATE family efflux transporter [Bacteroidales bacterium]
MLERLRGGAPLRFGHQVRLTATLSYPAIIAQFSTVAMQLIDTAMVGHLSTDAGAAIGLVATCMWLLGGFCFACCNGFSVQVAHLVGAGDFKGARSVVRQAMSSALIWCLGFTLLALAIARPLPLWLGGSGEVAAQASRYFLVTALFLPFLQFDFLAATILQASGEMRVPSLLNVLMCVLDVALNYLFIWVLDLGVIGAALGTGLAELMIATSMVWYLTCRCKDLKLRGEKGSFAPTRPVVNNALRIGLPLCLENIVMRGAYVAGTVIVAPLGAVAVAANNFAVTAESFCYMPGYGIADAATSLVGQSIGAGRRDMARRFGWLTTGGAMILQTLTGILLFVFAPEVMGLISSDPEVVSLGATVLRIEAFAETMYAASIVSYGACVGAGDTLLPSILNFSSIWVFRIVPAIWLCPRYGLVGYWIAMCFELNMRGALFLFYLARGRWLRLKSTAEL